MIINYHLNINIYFFLFISKLYKFSDSLEEIEKKIYYDIFILS